MAAAWDEPLSTHAPHPCTPLTLFEVPFSCFKLTPSPHLGLSRGLLWRRSGLGGLRPRPCTGRSGRRWVRSKLVRNSPTYGSTPSYATIAAFSCFKLTPSPHLGLSRGAVQGLLWSLMKLLLLCVHATFT